METITQTVKIRKTPFIDIFSWALGNGAISLIMNGIFGFSMLYYGQALGLSMFKVGLAMSIPTFWDAITDPVMGHITDNTRSRWGRRHPYILLGGLASVVSFYFIWKVPGIFLQGEWILFTYLLATNIILRTGLTVFMIPFGALGMEICTDYDQRADLNATGVVVNMTCNLLGPAMAWFIFFGKGLGEEVAEIGGVKPTSIPQNYINMGTTFTIASLAFILLVVFLTRKYAKDSRNLTEMSGGSALDFFRDMKDIVLDRNPRTVFLFQFCVYLGIVFVSAIQMFVYVHFMNFTGMETFLVHGATMVGCGIGAGFSSLLTRWIDKKPSVFFGGLVSVGANFLMGALFLTGILSPGQKWLLGGAEIPIATITFGILGFIYWFGNGVHGAICASMMADISEVNKRNTGILKDGAYAAFFSFLTKCSMAVALLIVSICIDIAGFNADLNTQPHEVVMRLGMMMFFIAPAISLASVAIMYWYPIDRKFMMAIKAELAARETLDTDTQEEIEVR